MYESTEPLPNVKFGEGTQAAIATWTSGYDKISAIEDDHQIVFILESTNNKLYWIPPEIIISLGSSLATRQSVQVP